MPQIINYDDAGFFDAATGENISLNYDATTGQFYNALTGESAQLIGSAIAAAQNTLIGIFGQQGYPPQRTQQYPQNVNNQRQPVNQSPASFNTQGVNLKWYTLLGIGAAVALVLTGRRFR